MIKYLGSKRKLVPVLGAMARAVRGSDRRRPVRRDDAGGAGAQAAAGSTSLRLTSRPTPRCWRGVSSPRTPTRSTQAALAAALSELSALPGERGYFTARSVRTPDSSAQERDACRRDPYGDRAALRRGRRSIRSCSLADACGGPGGLDHRRADGLSQAMGAPLNASWSCGCQSCCPAAERRSGATRRRCRASSRGWTWRISTRRTTSIGTSRTTTCGRPSSDGTPPPTTALRASGSTVGTQRRRASSTAGERCPALRDVLTERAADVVVVSYNDEAWVSPSDIATWLREAGHAEVRMLGFDSKRYVGAQIGIHDPQGPQGRKGVAPAQHRVPGHRRPGDAVEAAMAAARHADRPT